MFVYNTIWVYITYISSFCSIGAGSESQCTTCAECWKCKERLWNWTSENSKKIGDPPEENHNFRGISKDSLTHGLCISQSTSCKCLGRAGTRQPDFWSPTPKTRRSPWKNNSWSSCDHRKNSALPTGMRTGLKDPEERRASNLPNTCQNIAILQNTTIVGWLFGKPIVF